MIIFAEARGISAVGSAQHWQCWGQEFESPMLHHNLSENHGFQTFLLFISDIKPSKKAKNRGLSPPVFPISCVKVRNKSACAQQVDGAA